MALVFEPLPREHAPPAQLLAAGRSAALVATIGRLLAEAGTQRQVAPKDLAGRAARTAATILRVHGVDVRLKVVNTGTDMVNAMQKREVQVGDMSVTTFLKARHHGDAFTAIALIMNDATTSNADFNGARWSNTTCPNGTNSSASHPQTC